MLAHQALAGCDQEALRDAMGKVRTGFTEMSSTIDADRRVFEESLLCQSTPLTPPLAARVHFTLALAAFLDGDDETTRREFARARLLEPEAPFPAALAPRDHPLHKAWTTAVVKPTMVDLPSLPVGTGWVDGEPATRAPSDLPFVYQLEYGSQVRTALIPVGGSVPKIVVDGPAGPGDAPKDVTPELAPVPEPTKPTEVEEPPPPTPTDAGRRKRRTAGLLVTGVGAVAYSSAFATRAAYGRAVDAGDQTAIDRSHRATNVLTVAGAGLALGGAGLAISGVL